jgi:hypothetical protein
MGASDSNDTGDDSYNDAEYDDGDDYQHLHDHHQH